MTDDLVKRLREYCDGNNDLMDAAADRIETLEVVLREVKRRLIAVLKSNVGSEVKTDRPQSTGGEDR